MKSLFETARVDELKERVARLTPQSPRQWGKMNAAQAVAHCAMAFELSSGERKPPRALIGRLIGGIIKPLALGDDKPCAGTPPL